MIRWFIVRGFFRRLFCRHAYVAFIRSWDEGLGLIEIDVQCPRCHKHIDISKVSVLAPEKSMPYYRWKKEDLSWSKPE